MMKKFTCLSLPVAMVFLFWSAAVTAQTDGASPPTQDAPAEEQPADPPEGLAGHLAEADRLAGEIERLRAELSSAEGEEKSLVLDQLVRSKKAYRENLTTLVEDVADPGAGAEGTGNGSNSS